MENYKDKSLTIHERTMDLLGRMSMQEKIGQVNQKLYGWECYTNDPEGYNVTEYLKEHVRWGGGVGAIYGVLRADPWSKVNYSNGVSIHESHKLTNILQQYVIENSRLGIPALFVEECPHGHQALDSPSFPTNIGKGNSFDRDLVQQMASAQAEELKIKGIHLALVPTLDLGKDPRWGRIEECYGEDPYLSAQFTESVVKGFQGGLIEEEARFVDKKVSLPEKNIGVVLKHFIAQGEVQGGHNSGAVAIGKRDFNETYNLLIHACRNAVGIMAAYNDIDGVPCHINKKILQDYLREKSGFQGIVMADGTALDRLTNYFSSEEEAIKAALEAGVDLSLWDDLYTNIHSAIDKYPKLLKTLDQAVYRILSIKFLLGLFDDPYITVTKEKVEEVLKKLTELNRKFAHESITLLKNNATLPLVGEGKIAVIGPNADSIYNLLGDYTAPQNGKEKSKTIYRQLQSRIPDLIYEKGCEIRDMTRSEQLIDEAERSVNNCDTVILALGGSSARRFDMDFMKNGAVTSKGVNMDCGENVDVANLTLGGSQLELLKRIKKAGKRIITLIVEGRPLDLTEVIELSDAVLLCWYPGIEGGPAITDILLGDYNPDGKLSISYPRNSTQLPVYYYQRDVAKNENYYDLPGSPLFPFGYGLHYGKVSVKNIEVVFKEVRSAYVQVELVNESSYSVRESILVYGKYNVSGKVPQKERLIYFDSIELNAKETKVVSFNCYINDYNYTSEDIYNTSIKLFDTKFDFEG